MSKGLDEIEGGGDVQALLARRERWTDRDLRCAVDLHFLMSADSDQKDYSEIASRLWVALARQLEDAIEQARPTSMIGVVALLDYGIEDVTRCDIQGPLGSILKAVRHTLAQDHRASADSVGVAA